MNTKRILISILAAICFTYSYGQQLEGDSLVSDFKCLVKYLEETHPDPYSGFGGKVFFHKSAFDIEQKLKQGKTKEEFGDIVSLFMSNLEDGHTRINIPNVKNDSNLILPLNIRTTPEGLMAIVVPETNKELLGCKILSINQIPVDSLLKKVKHLYPVENQYGAYANLSYSINSYKSMKKLMPDMERKIAIEFESPAKKIVKLQLSYLNDEDYKKVKMTFRPKWSKINEDKYMYFDFLDSEKQAMLFHLGSIQSREQFLTLKKRNWPDFQNVLKQFYEYYYKQDMPESQDEAITKIPSLSETFRNMLEEMKKNKSKYLIIDLRDNGGGWTPIVPATLYQLYGDQYLKKDMDINFYRIISPLYMQKLGTTLDEFNSKSKTNYTFGDYNFSIDKPEKQSIEEIRNKFVENIFGGIRQPIEDLNGHPVYSPEKVFVITNEYTFSAAFHYAFYLWKMGAIIVGVPSSQAPNTFMENTEFQLPYTKLTGTISNSAQIFLPSNDKRAKIFYPDIMLSWKDYGKYNFDKYSDLLFLLDSLNLKYIK